MSTVLDAQRGHGRRAVDPPGLAREHMLARHIPYLSAVGDDVLMLRDGDVMGSLVVQGIPAQTADRMLVDDVARAMAGIVAQAKADVAFHVHRISHEVRPAMAPRRGRRGWRRRSTAPGSRRFAAAGCASAPRWSRWSCARSASRVFGRASPAARRAI